MVTKIGIITDSTCDIPQDLIEKYAIGVVPLMVTLGDRQYRDRVDLQPGEFYDRLTTNREPLHTSQPAVTDFQHAYEHEARQGASELCVMTLSSTLSGTYESARQAARDFKLPITLVDTKGTSMGMGWQVLAAARAREAGASVKGILEKVNTVRKKITQMVGLDTMEYVQKGGRLGAAVKWAGSLLRIKPLVGFDPSTNLVVPIGLARSYKSLVDLLHRHFFSRLKGKNRLHIAVLHGGALDAARQLAQRIRDECDPLELLINSTGPAVGIHTGPGALGLCGYSED
jgi:DegV family protein with EDD domain